MKYISFLVLGILTSCTLALSETEIKDTKGNISEGTTETQKPDIAPTLTVPVSIVPKV